MDSSIHLSNEINYNYLKLFIADSRINNLLSRPEGALVLLLDGCKVPFYRSPIHSDQLKLIIKERRLAKT